MSVTGRVQCPRRHAMRFLAELDAKRSLFLLQFTNLASDRKSV